MQTIAYNQTDAYSLAPSATTPARSNSTDRVWILVGVAIGALSGGVIGIVGIMLWSVFGGPALGIPLILGGVVAPLLGSFSILMVGASGASPQS